jgi:hypothetical protein
MAQELETSLIKFFERMERLNNPATLKNLQVPQRHQYIGIHKILFKNILESINNEINEKYGLRIFDDLLRDFNSDLNGYVLTDKMKNTTLLVLNAKIGGNSSINNVIVKHLKHLDNINDINLDSTDKEYRDTNKQYVSYYFKNIFSKLYFESKNKNDTKIYDFCSKLKEKYGINKDHMNPCDEIMCEILGKPSDVFFNIVKLLM